MSYLTLAKGIPDFSKAVISFWFRVPQVSIDAAKAAFVNEDGVPFNRIIPLVVMGEPGDEGDKYRANDQEFVQQAYSNQNTIDGLEGHNLSYVQIGMCPQYGIFSKRMEGTDTYNLEGHFVPQPDLLYYRTYNNIEPSGEPAIMKNPTSIGVDLLFEDEPTLYVNFSTNQRPSVERYYFNTSLVLGPPVLLEPVAAFDQGTRISQWCTPPFGLDIEHIGPIDEISNTIHTVYYPQVSVATGVEHFDDASEMILNGTQEIGGGGLIPVAADHWHHVLISIDATTIETHGRDQHSASISPDNYDSASHLFIALDDVNFTGFDLSDNWVEGSDDLNAVVNDDASTVVGSFNQVDEDGNSLGAATYILENPVIQCNGKALGLPAVTDFVNNIYQADMAEFQMWTGISHDTADETFRRLFLDYKRDDNGHPVPDKDGHFTLKPVDMAKAATLLGQPDIVLHGSSNWKKGNNTGSLGYTIDPDTGKPIVNPAGQFTPTGTINSYKPDPSIPPPADVTPVEIKVKPKAKAPA